YPTWIIRAVMLLALEGSPHKWPRVAQPSHIKLAFTLGFLTKERCKFPILKYDE
ncbi:unnamed protein product, partial [Sphenostylis stenocarpa]